MNISAISGIGNLQQTRFKMNNPISLRTSDEEQEQKETSQPSFKANHATLKNASKAIALSTMLGLSALANNSCKKTTEPATTYVNEYGCECASIDLTEYSRNFVYMIPKSDEAGREAYLKWYNENLETRIIDPDCCHHIAPVDPEWDERCLEWITNYLTDGTICE